MKSQIYNKQHNSQSSFRSTQTKSGNLSLIAKFELFS